MSGYAGSPLDRLPFPLMDQPQDNALQQFSPLRGYPGLTNPQQPVPAPVAVGNQHTQSLTMPSPLFDPLAYWLGGAPVTQIDNARAEARQRERYDLGMTMATGFAGGTSPGGAARNALKPLQVFHGSPHEFPPTARNPLGEFSIEHIGKGEGAQAYGHGVAYVAGHEPVATHYRDALGGRLTPQAQKLWDEAANRQRQAIDERWALHDQARALSKEKGYRPHRVDNGWGDLTDDYHPAVEAQYRPLLDAAQRKADGIAAEQDEIMSATRPKIDGKPMDLSNPLHTAVDHLDSSAGDLDVAIRRAQAEIIYAREGLAKATQNGVDHKIKFYGDELARFEGALGHLQSGADLPKIKKPGHMYEAELNIAPHEMLDFDVPIGRQHAEVRANLADRLPYTVHEVAPGEFSVRYMGGARLPDGLRGFQGSRAEALKLAERRNGNIKGEDLVPRSIEDVEAMVKAGVKGMRYLDGSSRKLADELAMRRSNVAEAERLVADRPRDRFGKEALAKAQARLADIEAKAHYNYVVFDAATLNIIRRYGIGAILGGGAAAGAGGVEAAPRNALSGVRPIGGAGGDDPETPFGPIPPGTPESDPRAPQPGAGVPWTAESLKELLRDRTNDPWSWKNRAYDLDDAALQPLIQSWTHRLRRLREVDVGSDPYMPTRPPDSSDHIDPRSEFKGPTWDHLPHERERNI